MFVSSAEGTGGGHMRNLDEAYELSLNYCRRFLTWRNGSHRILVMIGDCRPHERNYPLNKNRIDWNEETKLLREKDDKIYAVQCEQRSYANSFYQRIASETFGHHVTLTDFSEIKDILMNVCYREAGLLQTQNLTMSTINQETFISQTAGTVASEANEPTLSDNEDETDSEDEQQLDKSKSPSSNNFYLKAKVAKDKSKMMRIMIYHRGMVCTICKIGKLPNEFPQCPLSDECDHLYASCMRCTVRYVEDHGSCPHPSCDIVVDKGSSTIKLYEAVLDTMFKDYGQVLEQSRLASRPEGDVIGVSTINGDTVWFTYKPSLKVSTLKTEIGKRLKLRPEQQKLIFNENTMKKDACLSDYGMKSYDTISLILPLFCVPEHLDHVIFDLSWEFPPRKPDFLDASCFAFEKETFIQVIDWNHPNNDYFLQGSIKHSEQNLTGPGSKTGHQTIHVYLKKVPAKITHLYFTLSSWRSPDLSAFKNPNLKFFDATDASVNLCETTFTHARNSQAVIMCSVVRTGKDWQIFECGTNGLANGNSKKYNPIRKKIVQLIQEDL